MTTLSALDVIMIFGLIIAGVGIALAFIGLVIMTLDPDED